MTEEGKKLQDLFKVQFSNVENSKFTHRDLYPNKELNGIVHAKDLEHEECNLFTRYYVVFIDKKPMHLIFEGPVPTEELRKYIVNFVENLRSIFGTEDKRNNKMSDEERKQLYNPSEMTANWYEFQEAGKYRIEFEIFEGMTLRFYIYLYKNL